MKKSRFTTEQIIGFIKQAEAGMAVSELARQNGFSPRSDDGPAGSGSAALAQGHLAAGSLASGHGPWHGTPHAAASAGLPATRLPSFPSARRRRAGGGGTDAPSQPAAPCCRRDGHPNLNASSTRADAITRVARGGGPAHYHVID